MIAKWNVHLLTEGHSAAYRTYINAMDYYCLLYEEDGGIDEEII